MKLVDGLSKPLRKKVLAGVSALSIFLSNCAAPSREHLPEKNKAPSLKEKHKPHYQELAGDLINYSDNFEEDPTDENLRVVRKSISDLLDAFPDSFALTEVPNIAFYFCPDLREDVIRKLEDKIINVQDRYTQAGIYANLASLVKHKSVPLQTSFAELVIPIVKKYEQTGMQIDPKAIPEKIDESQAAIAEEYYKRAISSCQNSKDSFRHQFSLGEFYNEIGRKKEAQELLIESAVSCDAGILDSFLYYQIGKISSEIKDFNAAEEWFVNAIKSDDGKKGVSVPIIKSYFLLGEMYVQNGDLDRAEKLAEELTALQIKGRIHEFSEEPVTKFLGSLVERGRTIEVKKYTDAATQYGTVLRNPETECLYKLRDKIEGKSPNKNLEIFKRHK